MENFNIKLKQIIQNHCDGTFNEAIIDWNISEPSKAPISLYEEITKLVKQEFEKPLLGLMHDTARPLLRIDGASILIERACKISNCDSKVTDEYLPRIKNAKDEIFALLDNFYKNNK